MHILAAASSQVLGNKLSLSENNIGFSDTVNAQAGDGECFRKRVWRAVLVFRWLRYEMNKTIGILPSHDLSSKHRGGGCRDDVLVEDVVAGGQTRQLCHCHTNRV